MSIDSTISTLEKLAQSLIVRENRLYCKLPPEQIPVEFLESLRDRKADLLEVLDKQQEFGSVGWINNHPQEIILDGVGQVSAIFRDGGATL